MWCSKFSNLTTNEQLYSNISGALDKWVRFIKFLLTVIIFINSFQSRSHAILLVLTNCRLMLENLTEKSFTANWNNLFFVMQKTPDKLALLLLSKFGDHVAVCIPVCRCFYKVKFITLYLCLKSCVDPENFIQRGIRGIIFFSKRVEVGGIFGNFTMKI